MLRARRVPRVALRHCSGVTGLPSRDELRKLSVKDLKLLAVKRKMTTDDCVEKAQIIDKILGEANEPTKQYKKPAEGFFTEGEKKIIAYVAGAMALYIAWKVYNKIERKEVRELRVKAKNGDGQAAIDLAKALYHGEGVTRNTKEAFELIKAAADAGDAWAQCEAGGMYCRGEGVEQNYKAGFQLFKLAAGQGHRNAMFNLSKLYEVGIGTEPHLGLAEDWRKRAKDTLDVTEQVLPIVPPTD